MDPNPVRRTRGRSASGRGKSVALLALLAGAGVGATYHLLETRPSQRSQTLASLEASATAHECCAAGPGASSGDCSQALRGIVDLARAEEARIDWPGWVPRLPAEIADALRGADDATRRAAQVFKRCPAAQEVAAVASTASTERLCGVIATPEERDTLARAAAQRGTLVVALARTGCSEAGFDAGLRRIQVDFAEICEVDACIEALLAAPSTSQTRVREIVAAHPNEVLSAIMPRLGPGQDPRFTDLMSYALASDARPLSSLGRGELSGLDLESASDLLELPLNPRKVSLLRYIRGHAQGPASAVAAVFLDAAEAVSATERELQTGLLELQKHQCALLERAVQRLDLGTSSRADAAIPALSGCQKAAQLALSDGDRLALTEHVLEAALKGQFGPVDELLIDRLDRAGPVQLRTLLALGERRELAAAAERIRLAVAGMVAERGRILGGAAPEGEEPLPEGRDEEPPQGGSDTAGEGSDRAVSGGPRGEPLRRTDE